MANDPEVDAELVCVAVRWVDDEPQPGIAEVQFTDAHGRAWTVIEKSAVLDDGDTVTRDADYPFPWLIRCTVLASMTETHRIRLAYGMCSTDGISEFEVHSVQLIPSFT